MKHQIWQTGICRSPADKAGHDVRAADGEDEVGVMCVPQGRIILG